jgi:hypothetical protein
VVLFSAYNLKLNHIIDLQQNLSRELNTRVDSKRKDKKLMMKLLTISSFIKIKYQLNIN